MSLIDNGRKIFYKDSFHNSEDMELYSLSSKPMLKYQFIDSSLPDQLDIFYSCKKRKENPELELSEGADSIETILEPNTRISYKLTNSNEGVFLVDVELTASPDDAYSLASVGDGKYVIGFRKMSLAIPESNGLEEQSVVIFTSNNIKPSDSAVFSYDIGNNTESTTPPPTTSTTPYISPDEKVSVYFLAVEEKPFIDDHYQDFKTRTWNIIKKACDDLPPENQISYTAYSCRQRCSMTSSTARGCAMVEMNLKQLPESVYCEGLGDMSRIEYFRSELNSMKSDLKTSYEAKRVTIDICNEISWSTEWVWISVGLVGGVVLLSLTIMALKRMNFKSGPRDKSDSSSLDEEKETKKKYSRINPAFETFE